MLHSGIKEMSILLVGIVLRSNQAEIFQYLLKIGLQCEHMSSAGWILGIDGLHADIVLPWEISRG